MAYVGWDLVMGMGLVFCGWTSNQHVLDIHKVMGDVRKQPSASQISRSLLKFSAATSQLFDDNSFGKVDICGEEDGHESSIFSLLQSADAGDAVARKLGSAIDGVCVCARGILSLQDLLRGWKTSPPLKWKMKP